MLAEITKWPVVVTGTVSDRKRSQELGEILGEWAVNLIWEATVSELAALIYKARLVIGNNSSAMHIVDATRTPSVY